MALQSCTAKVDIPEKHIGIVNEDGKINSVVLKPGEHLVSFYAQTIVYDISTVAFETNFDFLFSDVSKGELKISIVFTPISDSLPGFYRKYQTTHIKSVVDVETRKIVRSLLSAYNPIDLTKEEFIHKIIEAITNNNDVASYLDIGKVEIVELKF